MEGLKISDFIVHDNRRPVSLRYVSYNEDSLDLIFLFELTRDMAPRLSNLILAAEVAMSELREGDRVAVLSYNESVREEQPLTENLKEMRRRLRIGLAKATFIGRPWVLTSAVAATKFLPRPPEPRRGRAVIMFTGNAGFGLVNRSDLFPAAEFWRAEAALSAFVIPTVLTRITHDDNPAHFFGLTGLGFSLFGTLEGVVDQTGGDAIYAGDAGSVRHDPNPNAALQRVIRQMRCRYRLYYDRPASKPGQRREVQIELSAAAQKLHPEAKVICRKGYLIPTESR